MRGKITTFTIKIPTPDGWENRKKHQANRDGFRFSERTIVRIALLVLFVNAIIRYYGYDEEPSNLTVMFAVMIIGYLNGITVIKTKTPAEPGQGHYNPPPPQDED